MAKFKGIVLCCALLPLVGFVVKRRDHLFSLSSPPALCLVGKSSAGSIHAPAAAESRTRNLAGRIVHQV